MFKTVNRFPYMKYCVFAIAICLVVALLLPSISAYLNVTDQRSEIQQLIEEEPDEIISIIVKQNSKVPTGTLIVQTEENVYRTNITDTTEAVHMLQEKGLQYQVTSVQAESYFFSIYLPLALLAILLISIVYAIFTMLTSGMLSFTPSGTHNGNARFRSYEEGSHSSFGKHRAMVMFPDIVTEGFEDVAGLEEEKEELRQVVDFLKNPKKYTKMGARVPKGILLVGPPGNGKTLLAKAVAGEAGVYFYSISGSDFMEMYVGVGAARVRDLFDSAKETSPSIIFIDEIDAIGRHRGAGVGGGHDEREQTLNQLLVEMDGFHDNSGVIVMAATNRADILDQALLRPGRFDRRITVQPPDVKARLEILQVHARKKPLAEEVDLEKVAQTTAGFSGADLANLLNEAAILAASRSLRQIGQREIEEAFIKVGVGAEKHSRVVSEKDRRITAYHEAGHALLYHLLPLVGPVHMVSIVPTSQGAAGFTMPLPEQDEMFETRDRMYQQIVAALGGRTAEELVFGNLTTGASSDIKQATNMARAMVTRFGMSEVLGPVSYNETDGEVFLGRDLTHTRSYSEHIAEQIDEEVKNIISEANAEAGKLLSEHRAELNRCAELLMEREKLSREEFEEIFEQNM